MLSANFWEKKKKKKLKGTHGVSQNHHKNSLHLHRKPQLSR